MKNQPRTMLVASTLALLSGALVGTSVADPFDGSTEFACADDGVIESGLPSFIAKQRLPRANGEEVRLYENHGSLDDLVVLRVKVTKGAVAVGGVFGEGLMGEPRRTLKAQRAAYVLSIVVPPGRFCAVRSEGGSRGSVQVVGFDNDFTHATSTVE